MNGDTSVSLIGILDEPYCEQTSSGPEVIKLFSCLTQLSMKLPTIVGILTFISWINDRL